MDWLRHARRRPLLEPGPTTLAVDLDRSALERLLRHRGPMLLLDRITAVDREQGTVVAERLLRAEDPAFDGHFPGDPVYPGSFQVEAMGQLGLTLSHLLSRGVEVPVDLRPPPVRLLAIHGASFVSEARPGDLLRVVARCVADTGMTLSCVGQLAVGERVVSACTFEALVGEEAA
ncbi:MAG: hypothetical protein H6735_34295 [Alphaproteobacteria bacterium]|nr:hypothetical protein [Alphaproteobacteria bacterium]